LLILFFRRITIAAATLAVSRVTLFAVKDVREVKLKKLTTVRALNFALKENILGYIKLLTA